MVTKKLTSDWKRKGAGESGSLLLVKQRWNNPLMAKLEIACCYLSSWLQIVKKFWADSKSGHFVIQVLKGVPRSQLVPTQTNVLELTKTCVSQGHKSKYCERVTSVPPCFPHYFLRKYTYVFRNYRNTTEEWKGNEKWSAVQRRQSPMQTEESNTLLLHFSPWISTPPPSLFYHYQSQNNNLLINIGKYE